MTNTRTDTTTDTATDTTGGSTTVRDDVADPLERLVDLHLAAYCEPDPAARVAPLAAAWTDDGRLVDPPMEATGRDDIAGLADVVLQHFPGHTFRRTTQVDRHHEFARYGWALVAPDGTVAVEGTDVARIGDDGRIAGIVGFFGDLAPR